MGFTARRMFSLLLAVSIVLLGQACSRSKVDDAIIDEARRYLASNVQAVELSFGFPKPSLLDSSLEEFHVFLSGEAHGIAEMRDVKIGLMKYFHEQAGVSDFLVESGHGTALLAQKYLETGDEKWLDLSFGALWGTFAYNQESYDGWKELREWSLSFPDTERVRLWGIDVEHQYAMGMAGLRTLLPGAEAPQGIASLAERLIGSGTYPITRDETKTLAQEICSSLGGDNRTAWESYLGDNLFSFTLAVRAVVQGIEFYDSGSNMAYREDAIFSNFKDLYDHAGGRKFYGQLGGFHTSLQKNGNRETLGHLLNEGSGSAVKGRVLSIGVMCQDCESVTDARSWKTQKYSSDPAILSMFAPLAESTVTLYRLDGEGSPFAEPGWGTGDTDLSMADYSQFMLLIRNGHATTRLRP